MRKILVAAAIAGTMLGGAANAQMGGGGMMRADTNHDGVISRDEFMAAAAERFARMDANRDGRISGDELRMHGGGRDGRPGRMRGDPGGRGDDAAMSSPDDRDGAARDDDARPGDRRAGDMNARGARDDMDDGPPPPDGDDGPPPPPASPDDDAPQSDPGQ